MTDSDTDGLRILYCTIRDIGRHPWGGSWYHGNGEAISPTNLRNILIARNVVADCTNTGCWLDNYPNRGTISGVRFIGNEIRNVPLGIFAELRVNDVLMAYNVFDRCGSGMKIGPIAMRNRLLGNLVHETSRFGAALSVYSRAEDRTDTVENFVLAGNVFSECGKYSFVWSNLALENGRQYFDRNIWHATADANDGQGSFHAYDTDFSFADAWKRLRSDKFVAAGENSKVVSQSPVTRDANGAITCNPSPASLVTDELLDELTARGFLNDDERELLKTWHEKTAADLGVSELPADWTGPGSHLAEQILAGE